VNTPRIGIGETTCNGGVEFGQSTGRLLLVAVKRPEPGTDNLDLGLVGTGLQAPLNCALKIGRQVDAMALALRQVGTLSFFRVNNNKPNGCPPVTDNQVNSLGFSVEVTVSAGFYRPRASHTPGPPTPLDLVLCQIRMPGWRTSAIFRKGGKSRAQRILL
jgi:hypothetical protein